MLNFALAVTDNDEEVREQMSYAYLRTSNSTTSPWIGGERAWNFAIEMEPKWSLLPWRSQDPPSRRVTTVMVGW